jgi:hypothetical protein
MVAAGTISDRDLQLLRVTDDLGEAMEYIEQHAVQVFGLRRRPPHPSRLLGEPREIPAITS